MIWGFGWHRMHSHTDETGLRDIRESGGARSSSEVLGVSEWPGVSFFWIEDSSGSLVPGPGSPVRRGPGCGKPYAGTIARLTDLDECWWSFQSQR